MILNRSLIAQLLIFLLFAGSAGPQVIDSPLSGITVIAEGKTGAGASTGAQGRYAVTASATALHFLVTRNLLLI